jgi:hypothetical protein
MTILDLGYREVKEKLHDSSHNIPTMMQTNHCLKSIDHQPHLKQSITLMNATIPPQHWKSTTPNAYRLLLCPTNNHRSPNEPNP